MRAKKRIIAKFELEKATFERYLINIYNNLNSIFND